MPLFFRNPTKLEPDLANGSRIVCLPASPRTIVGFSSIDLLVIDEAGLVDDALYDDVLPMLAVSNGSFVLLSTPRGRRGFFYEEWHKGVDFERYRITWDQCPRLANSAIVAKARRRGTRYFAQNYETSFLDAVGQLIPQAEIDAAFDNDLKPLFQTLR